MTEERDGDEVLGRALSRAIETQSTNETPFERSRIGTAPTRRGFPVWQTLGVAAAVALAIAFGSWFTRPTDTGPVASSATPTAAGSNPSTTSAPASATPTTDTTRTFFVRDLVPPVSAFIPGTTTQARAEQRIAARLSSTWAAPATSVPFGAANPIALVGRVTTPTGGSGSFGVSVLAVSGDTANVEFDLPNGWGVRGAAQVQALVQQLVYVITEEPGIRYARIVEKGKQAATIDGLVIDKSLSREDVSGYAPASHESITGGTGNETAPELTTQWSVDTVSPGLARFVIQVASPSGTTAALPLFRVDVFQNDESNKPEGGKWRYSVTVSTGQDRTTHAIVDKSPLRALGAYPSKGAGTSVLYELGLDDLRPWRVFTLTNPTRIVLDIGGSPQAVSDRIAAYAPAAGVTVDSRISRRFTLAGAARTFEANVVWGVRDSAQKLVANGHTTASLGTSALWGTFETEITLPPGITGNVTVEVYEVSAKDGSELGTVRIPVAIR